MASSQPTRLLSALKASRGDLSIKTAKSEAWLHLESPTGDTEHNCYAVELVGGITVTQKNMNTAGTYILGQTWGSNPPVMSQSLSCKP